MLVVDTPIEPLAAQDADLDHVQPTGMSWRVVKLQPLEHAGGASGAGKALYKAPVEWVDRLSSTTRISAASG